MDRSSSFNFSDDVSENNEISKIHSDEESSVECKEKNASNHIFLLINYDGLNKAK